jgi:copper(I)-binding protein
MTMRPVQGGLEIKPGQTVVLKPESFHLMLTGLKQSLVKGEHVKATLEFAKSGKVDVDYTVEDIGAPGPSGGMGGTPGMPNMNQGH